MTEDVFEKVARLEQENARLRECLKRTNEWLDENGQHVYECACWGNKGPHSPDCKNCDCGLEEIIRENVAALKEGSDGKRETQPERQLPRRHL